MRSSPSRIAGTGTRSTVAARSLGAVGTSAGKRMAEGTWRFARARPGFVLGAVAILAVGGAVARNTLTEQATRHPAPLFGQKVAGTPADPPRRPDPAPAPIPAPRPEIATTQSIPEPRAEAPRASSPDPIGSLIRTGSALPSTPRPSEPKGDAQRVAAAQKALTKLGYGPLKADGLIGGTTKQALEKFEREHKLPVTGVLGPRTARQLASASGLTIE